MFHLERHEGLSAVLMWGGLLVSCAGGGLAADSKNIAMLPPGLAVFVGGGMLFVLGWRMEKRANSEVQSVHPENHQ